MNSTQAQETPIAGNTRTAGPFVRVFNRIFSRHMMNMAVLIIVPTAFSASFNPLALMIADPDIWWHLADARIITTTHHMIWTDPYSFTAAGQRWIDWEWLSELPYWLSFKSFGLRGIYLVTRFALCANILFIYWRGYWRSRHAGAAFWAAALGYVLMTVNAGPRMIMFAYLAMSAELAILDAAGSDAAESGKKRLVWLLPPLFCLWINLHGTWLIGICLFGLYILCGLFPLKVGAFDQLAFGTNDRNRLLTVFGLSVLALLANPYGWHLLLNPFDMMLNQKLSVATIVEWQPLSFSSIEGRGVVAAIVLMVVANLISSRKWKVYELAVILLAWYAAMEHHRFTFLAAVITTPMLSADLKRAFFTESDAKTIPVMNFIMAAGAICVMAVAYPTEASLQETLGMVFPLKSISSVQPSWRTLNGDYVGGLMAFEFKPTFMDSRFDSFEHNGVMADYRNIAQGHDALALMDKYHVDHALLTDGMPITDLLLHTPGWRVEMREKAWLGEYVLLARDPDAAAHP